MQPFLPDVLDHEHDDGEGVEHEDKEDVEPRVGPVVVVLISGTADDTVEVCGLLVGVPDVAQGDADVLEQAEQQ